MNLLIRFKHPAIILILISLCSCFSQSDKNEKQHYVWLANNSKFVLLPPEKIEKSMDMAQFISASWQGSEFYLNAWVQADENGMEISLFNELGANMGSLSYKENALYFSSPVLPKSLQPEYIVADFQLCFYKTDALSEALEKCGLVLEIDKTIRRIQKGNDIIIEIELKQDTVILKNNLRGYSYALGGDFS
ncbi:MAG: DUF3261 domain-containing protein [Treponema sp.]|nr:DUF3261 domain-containing protein [Treponema sp.]